MKRAFAWMLALMLVFTCLPALAEDDGSIREGDKGDQVLKLQERLIELGFLNATADGIYGKKTSAAVRAFHALLLERAGGKPSSASGRSISAEDLEALYLDPFSFYISDLKSGDNGSEVERLQGALVRLNYMDGEADGYFAEYTEAAVKYFQELNNLPVTGVADKATQDLAASGGIVADHPAYRVVEKGDKGASVKAIQKKLIGLGLMLAPEDGYYGADLVEALQRFEDYLEDLGDPFVIEDARIATIELQKKLNGDIPVYMAALKTGSEDSSEVRRLQRRLNALGYIGRLTVDGQYGSGVRDAITLFQTNNGLPETGEADEATQRLLFSDDPVGMLTDYRLSVSLAEQRVYVYKLGADKKYEQIDTFLCSTGLFGPTPRGVFNTTVPGRRWHYFKEFDIWAQYAYSIEGDILFHSVLFKRKGGSPTWGSVNGLGHKASHGCVRLSVEHAKWIYENCKRGTVVTIY
jgi:peptidoglycan hydrolase-like protein with peptidoglycan-binding domain